MTQDEIYKMVRQSDLGFLLKDNWMMHHEFVAFANLVAAKATEEANAKANASWTLMCKKMVAIEREACAKVCEDYGRAEEMQAIGNDYAQAIRARRTSMTQEALKQLIEDLISMMEYHVEQTRPIHKTTVALQAAREALKALAQQAQEPVKWSDYEPDGVHHNKPEQEPVAWKLMPRDATDAMLKAMDECSTEGYDERLYAGHAASVYMAAWDEAPTPPQRTEQKPVAWRAPNWGHGDDEWVYRDFDDPVLIADGKPSPNNEALYTAPPQRTWVGLTKEQLATTDWSADFRAGALWAEAKLKQKNGIKE